MVFFFSVTDFPKKSISNLTVFIPEAAFWLRALDFFRRIF